MTLAFFFIVTTVLYASVEPGHRIYEGKWLMVALNAGAFGLIAYAMNM